MILSQLFSVSHCNFAVAQIDFSSLRINSDFLIFPLLHSQEAKYTAGSASEQQKGGTTNDENERRPIASGAGNRVPLLQLGRGELPAVGLSMSAAAVPDKDQLHLFSGSGTARFPGAVRRNQEEQLRRKRNENIQ